MREERLQIIENLLLDTSTVKVSDLVNRLNVSLDTVRRDLEYLEQRGILKRVHGGAVGAADFDKRQSFAARSVKNRVEKQELAAKIVELIVEGDAVALNAGTTNIEVAHVLAQHFDRLTVITNSLRIVQIFLGKAATTVIVPGGFVNHEEYSLQGRRCEAEIGQYNIHKAIIAVNAIALEKGITDFRREEVGVINAMIRSAQISIAALDSSKFETVSYINVCPVKELDWIVTDSKLNSGLRQKYESYGVRVLKA